VGNRFWGRIGRGLKGSYSHGDKITLPPIQKY
jgi:hypothetical protein